VKRALVGRGAIAAAIAWCGVRSLLGDVPVESGP
jgi:hypothetical protein